jgi:hypothetical protein
MNIVQTDNKIIGGVGKEVKIHESKFGNRNFHRGGRVDGIWVLGVSNAEVRSVLWKMLRTEVQRL